MPQGSKESYSSKQKRMARHIEDSEKKSGKSTKSAERIAWATVNKQTGGAKKKSASSGTKKKTGGSKSSGSSRSKKSGSKRTTH